MISVFHRLSTADRLRELSLFIPKTSIMKVSSFSTNLRTNVLNTSKMKDGSFPFTGMALTVIEFSHEFFFRKSRKVQL